MMAFSRIALIVLVACAFEIYGAVDYSHYNNLHHKQYNRKSGSYWRRSNFDTVAWTPELISPLLLASSPPLDDVVSPLSRSRTIINVSATRTSAVPKRPEDNRVLSTFRNRAENRIKIASRTVSHACHVAVNYAGSRSIGGKLLSDCHSLIRSSNFNSQSDDFGDRTISTHSYLGKGYEAAMAVVRKRGSLIEEISDPYNDNSLLREDERNELISRVDNLVSNVEAALLDVSLWEEIVQKDGVTVWRTKYDVKNYLSPQLCSHDIESDHCTIRSETIMNAPPSAVYELFMDNARVSEYNENCQELEDIAFLSKDSKISWCATGRLGPFSARDFVTLVTFRELKKGDGYMSLAANVDHPTLAPKKPGYVRSQIQLAATYMIPVEGKPDLTRFVQVTQVGELGGVADTAIAKRITKNLAEKAPVDFMKKFEVAVKKGLREGGREM